MGYATIVSGGEAGRYTITMDYGESTRVALLAALSVLLSELDVKIAAAQDKVNEADAKEAAAEARYNTAVDEFIAAGPFFAPGSPRPDDSAILFALARLRELQTAHQPLRLALAAVKLDRSIALKRVAYWNNFVATNTRQAWCTDFTEDAAPGQVVATMEIPGDDNLIIIAAGARAWAEADGYLAARELMSPEQVFFNAAIFPGWQIDKPTYRWGTVTAVDMDLSTLDVSLAPALSSAQRLNVNRQSALAAVPTDYMETGAAVFEVGDRVVVQFQGQSWAAPRVVGFVDNPRVPGYWDAYSYAYFPETEVVPFTSAGLLLRIRETPDFDLSALMTAAAANTIDASFRVDRASWQPLFRRTPAVGYNYSTEDNDDSPVVIDVSTSRAAGPDVAIALDAIDTWLGIGQVLEARMFIGGELVMNVAWRFGPVSGAGPVAIVGRLLPPPSSSPFLLPMTRLTYNLFQTSGT